MTLIGIAISKRARANCSRANSGSDPHATELHAAIRSLTAWMCCTIAPSAWKASCLTKPSALGRLHATETGLIIDPTIASFRAAMEKAFQRASETARRFSWSTSVTACGRPAISSYLRRTATHTGCCPPKRWAAPTRASAPRIDRTCTCSKGSKHSNATA